MAPSIGALFLFFDGRALRPRSNDGGPGGGTVRAEVDQLNAVVAESLQNLHVQHTAL